MPKEHLKEAFKKVRQENGELQKKLRAFQNSMVRDSIEISPEFHKSLSATDTSAIREPMQKLFWEEQQKALMTKKRGMRWHPMMIRLAILLHSKSKAAYETLRTTGVVELPAETTLRQYTSAVRLEQGFQPEVMAELKKFADSLQPHQRYVVLLHDEMTIKSDLVFDERSGALVGFVNKDMWTFEKMATHALVFYVVGVNSHLKMSLGYFGTRTATSDQLMPLLWTAIGCVEECGLQVVASTSDKASPNQRLYQLHQIPGIQDVCFKAVNMFAPERVLSVFHFRPTSFNKNCEEQPREQWE
ncbi:hypothetical protein BaRGS_00028537 [Batillaria attramentaria]|uniref:Transposable element P transposase-like RNase H domain-containing protein n=1 Tax=Batillaria attramentaria TaxID=370345 RepID=A0ABD0JYX2_9CAEN